MRLNITFLRNPRLQPLLDGSIQPEEQLRQRILIERLFAESTRET